MSGTPPITVSEDRLRRCRQSGALALMAVLMGFMVPVLIHYFG